MEHQNEQAGGQTEQVRLALSGQATLAGLGQAPGFEILAITAGSGNGWEFGGGVLRDSLQLWDGRECFVDHDMWGHSVRDLAGVLHSPEWDESRQGVKLKLKPVGPSGPVLEALGKDMLGDGPKPDVGFSADVLFTANGRKVEKILRVLSVDVVMKPARGGQFLRALNSRLRQAQPESRHLDRGKLRQAQLPENQLTLGGIKMDEESKTPVNELEKERAAIREILDAHQQQQAMAEEAEKAKALRVEMCSYLLEQGLAAAKLPAAVADRVRGQFAGKVFEPAELSQAIEDGRKLVSELTGALVVQGPGRIHGMYSSEDQLTAAVHDLLGAERPKGLEDLKAAKLSGIRELYTMMTGDYEFYGGYKPERAQLATTASLPGLLKDTLNKMVVMGWQELGRSGYRWWEPIVSVEHFTSLHDITGVLVGEVTVLPAVDEGAPYTELPVKDSAEVGTWGKYGGYVGLTLEMFERDETHKLRQYPRKLASAALRRISALVGSVFTAGGGVGPTMADTKAVFHIDHGNLGTGALASATWEAASAAIYNQAMLVGAAGVAPKLALDAKYLLVPRTLRLTAMRLLYPTFEREANIFSDNMQKGEYGDVITVPEFTDATDWAAVADPKLAPGIIIGERFGLLPEIFVADAETNGALFTNDEIRMKVRHWCSVFVADYRPLYKANVAG